MKATEVPSAIYYCWYRISFLYHFFSFFRKFQYLFIFIRFMRLCSHIIHIILRLYSPLRGFTYRLITGLTSTCRRIDMRDHPSSLGMARSQNFGFPNVIDIRDQDDYHEWAAINKKSFAGNFKIYYCSTFIKLPKLINRSRYVSRILMKTYCF